MHDRFKKFFSSKRQDSYGFWSETTDQSPRQIKIIRKILSRTYGRAITILDVGCGDGVETKKAISNLNKNVKVFANDTSLEALKRYRSNLAGHIIGTEQRRLERLPDLIEDRFDLIIFSHCLYHAKLDGLFNRYLPLLKEDGSILIFLESEKSNILMTRKKFWRAVHSADFDENSAEDIAEELRLKKIPHKVIGVSYQMDISKLEAIHPEGFSRLFIPFVMRTDKIPKERKRRILEFAESTIRGGKIKLRTLAIVVRKQNSPANP